MGSIGCPILRFGEPYSGLDEYSGPGGDIFPTPPSAKTHVFVKLVIFFQNIKLFVMGKPFFCCDRYVSRWFIAKSGSSSVEVDMSQVCCPHGFL